jgi:hypothetical protein
MDDNRYWRIADGAPPGRHSDFGLFWTGLAG